MTGGDGTRTHRTRLKRRLTATTTVLVVVLGGLAAAFFLTNQTFGGNNVSGGTLVVTQTGLPLDFDNKRVYPTDPDDPTYTVSDTFTLTNGNEVSISYLLSASCTDCSTDPSKQSQFDNLYARITPDAQIPGTAQPVFDGKLGDLDQTSLGTFAKGQATKFTIAVWLGDTGNEQAQNVTSLFDLVVGARTPPVPTPTTAPILPIP